MQVKAGVIRTRSTQCLPLSIVDSEMLYNPLEAPDPTRWLNLTDEDRFAAVKVFHAEAKLAITNRRNHCAMHVVIENQVVNALAPFCALTDRIVAGTLGRLVDEGLDRHEAIHAISEVTYGAFLALLAGETSTVGSDKYHDDLMAMTAETWRKRPPPLR